MLKQIINFFYFNTRFEARLKNAFNSLEKNKKIKNLYKLKERLSNIRYRITKNTINDGYFKYNLDLYLSLNQFIYSRLINKPIFTSKLMFSMANNDSFIFPLPKIYLDEINKIVKVNYLISKILFYTFLTFFFLYQLSIILKSAFLLFNKQAYKSKKILLDSVPKLNFESLKDDKEVNFFKWVIKKFDINSDSIFIHNNSEIKNQKITLGKNKYKVLYQKNIFTCCLNFNRYLLSLKKTLFIVIKIIFFGKIELLLLSKELFNFHLFECSKKDQNYDLCLFNNSNMVFRPLWTHVNERINPGSVFVYFYSTNLIPLLQEIDKEKYFDVYGYSLHSWPNYITWSDIHSEWLSNSINKKIKLIKTSFVPFAGKHTKLIKKRRTLTIFDVPPKKLGIYYLLNNPYNIYTLDYCKKFVEDIIRAIPESIYRDIDIIFKIKREYKNIHPLYKKYINEITSHKNIKLINDISPESVIDISDATISIPFTSTAITSLRKGKHSIYYDPSEKLSKNNCLENEVKLVTSFKELENWITDCFEK